MIAHKIMLIKKMGRTSNRMDLRQDEQHGVDSYVNLVCLDRLKRTDGPVSI